MAKIKTVKGCESVAMKRRAKSAYNLPQKDVNAVLATERQSIVALTKQLRKMAKLVKAHPRKIATVNVSYGIGLAVRKMYAPWAELLAAAHDLVKIAAHTMAYGYGKNKKRELQDAKRGFGP